MKVLVTGGAGYIGSHTSLELLQAGYEVTIVDNLANSSVEAVRRVERLAGSTPEFHQLDLLDEPALDRLFADSRFDAVIHFAAFKAVGESVAQPLEYYRNNVAGTVNLCAVMQRHGVHNLVFSSSATVYGLARQLPLTESTRTVFDEITNPYGRSKLIMEFVLQDWQVSWPQLNVALLRYFNPVGAHPSGEIGEDPTGVPNNLLPYVSQVAVGKLEQLQVFGGDYDTPDGTGVRDYIHVVDLAVGHLRALEKLQENPGVLTVNLGTGRGYSVLEVVQAFERASGRTIPYRIVERRPGDVAVCYAETARAAEILGWTAARDLDAMCEDTWRWQSGNPNGYCSIVAAPSD